MRKLIKSWGDFHRAIVDLYSPKTTIAEKEILLSQGFNLGLRKAMDYLFQKSVYRELHQGDEKAFVDFLNLVYYWYLEINEGNKVFPNLETFWSE